MRRTKKPPRNGAAWAGGKSGFEHALVGVEGGIDAHIVDDTEIMRAAIAEAGGRPIEVIEGAVDGRDERGRATCSAVARCFPAARWSNPPCG